MISYYITTASKSTLFIKEVATKIFKKADGKQ